MEGRFFDHGCGIVKVIRAGILDKFFCKMRYPRMTASDHAALMVAHTTGVDIESVA